MIKVKKIILKHNLQYLFLAIGLYIVKALLYFGVAKIPVTIHHFHMKIDELIPFNKYFYVFYFSYYILPILFLWILSFYNKDKFWYLICGALMANLIACLFFIFYQVQMIRPEYYENLELSLFEVRSVSEFFDFCIANQYNMDEGALNCFPSLHCVGGTLLALLGLKLSKKENRFPLWMRIFCVFFGCGIIASTVFVKQHYFIDSVCGTLLMIITYFMSMPLVNFVKKKIKIRKESKGVTLLES